VLLLGSYRALIKEALQDEAKSFCFDWLARTMAAAPSIPAEFNNCNARAASSACSCITYAATHTTQNTHTTKQSTSTIYSIKPHTVTNAERSRTALSTSQTSPVITFFTNGPPTTQHTHTAQPSNTTQTQATQATRDTQTIQTTQAAHNAKTINCDASTTYRIETHTSQPHATSSCFGQSGCPVGSITVTPYPTGAAAVRSKVSAMSVGSNIGVAPPEPSDSLVVAAAAGQIIASLGLVAAATVAALLL
jgi:hypothetical protein